MPQSIHHLERFPHFLKRVIALNQVYNPDDESHALLGLSGPEWEAAARGDSPATKIAARSRKVLHAIHDHFPRGAALTEQAAYLVRAFSGLRPFQEANHRTGWDYTAEVISHGGSQLLATTDEGRALGNDLWDDLRGELSVDRLTAKDEAFARVHEWLRTRIA